jgi:hypothetical protein
LGEHGDGNYAVEVTFSCVFIFKEAGTETETFYPLNRDFLLFISRIKVDLTTVGELKKGNRRRVEQNFSKKRFQEEVAHEWLVVY